MMVLTGAIDAGPKTALASRFAMKARADNKFSRKRSRRLGGSPSAHVSADAAELRQLSQKQLLHPPTAGARGKYGGTMRNKLSHGITMPWGVNTGRYLHG